ncbi:MAG: phosphoribosylanthranilate isomerase [Pseudomonadales bacterium]|nr:phosphoribosylanthranilate isomerase [Pseudomonadales bacterium]
MSSRVRVKICGITRREDALAAVHAGADAIGLVFYEKSPRAVTIPQALEITLNLPPFTSVVALFVDADTSYIERVLAELPIDCLQFHGNETPEQCAGFGRPYYKALRMGPSSDPVTFSEGYIDSSAVLLDAYDDSAQGGTGEVFDWSRVPANLNKPLVLAGGLCARNVAAAITQVRPYAVDVSSGVESSKGIKDHQKIEEFLRQVNRVR